MTDVMMQGKQALDTLQGGHGQGVDLAVFDADMSELGTSVRSPTTMAPTIPTR